MGRERDIPFSRKRDNNFTSPYLAARHTALFPSCFYQFFKERKKGIRKKEEREKGKRRKEKRRKEMEKEKKIFKQEKTKKKITKKTTHTKKKIQT